jgi:5,10-methylenetetrahydromethanopterin reductase
VRLSCAFAPGLATPDHIAFAERLGYARAWVFDSPNLYHDCWSTLARAADRTDTIGLATGVAVVGVRHVAVTASAVLGLEALAPGRVTLGLGAGGSAARTLGRPGARWNDIHRYAVAVRALVRGDIIKWDDAAVQLMHSDLTGSPRGVEIPVVFGVAGPRGEKVARASGDGVFTVREGSGDGFDWHCRLVSGTILDEDEDETSARIQDTAGPGAGLIYHQAYMSGNRELLDRLPGGAEMAAEFDGLPEGQRVAAVWDGSLVQLSDRDRRYITAAAAASLTFTGRPDAVRRRLEALAEQGVTEIVYQPCGPDIPRELTAFAAALA